MRPVAGRRSVIAFDEAGLGERPSRAVAAGRARRIARGVYTTDLTTRLDRLVRANLWEILPRLIPDALIVDRSAGPVLLGGDTLFIASSERARDVMLPGLRVAVRRGQSPFPDDMPWMGGFSKASIPRALVENLAPSRARSKTSRTLSDQELADWVAQLAQQYSTDRLNRFRDRARELAAVLDLAQRFPVLDDMFGAALGTGEADRRDLLGAMGRGHGLDVARMACFTQLAEALATGSLDPDPPRLPVLVRSMLREQPFFEAYLSNFIEGTEFTIEEAVRIVYNGDVPVARPADARDITGTYQLITDPVEASGTPGSGPELVAQLQHRHARLLAARPEKRPGEFKREANRFGSYHFVKPEFVRGTLERGLGLRDQLDLPISRAVYMMFLVSEVHPFDDGNGRLARLAMNDELTAAGEHRILVPLIMRADYLNGLRRLSRDGDPRLLMRVLSNAWRWSAQVDFSTLDSARSWAERTNALVDATDAERSGKYLVLPADLTV